MITPARTLEAVAKAAGVSKMTVSRVLRRPERVATATRERVLACIQKLGYRPNPLISTLMASTRRAKVGNCHTSIAFLVALPESALKGYEAVQRIYCGAKEQALAKGYEITLLSLADEKIALDRMGQTLRARGVEGVIFGPLNEEYSHYHFPLDQFACSACGFSLVEPKIHRVATHQWEIAAQAYLEAEKRGYKRIGFIFSSGFNQGFAQMWQSAALFHLERSGNKTPILTVTLDEREQFKRWVKRWKPDCLLASSREHYDWLCELGDAGRGIGFILLSGSSAERSISGMEKNYEGIGSAAVDLILLQLHNNVRGIPEFRQTVLLDPRWNPGETIPRE